MHKYDIVMDYSPDNSLEEAVEKDKKYNEFFLNLKIILRERPLKNS